MMQLDIFDHSRDVMLRNDVIAALLQRDATAADRALQQLVREYPADDLVPALSILVHALDEFVLAALPDHDALRRLRAELGGVVEPAARRVFGTPAGVKWLMPLWRTLAQGAEHLPLHHHDETHAVPLWLAAGEWTTACEAVTRIESWHRIPAALSWMAEATYRMHGLDAIWTLLAKLAWLSPGRLDTLIQRLDDPSLNMLRKTFDGAFDGDGTVNDLRWFPAWILTEKSGLSALLAKTPPSTYSPPERVMRLLVELLNLERHGRHHELFERRKLLQGLHPALFAAYIRTR
jgi:hypothetical protein